MKIKIRNNFIGNCISWKYHVTCFPERNQKAVPTNAKRLNLKPSGEEWKTQYCKCITKHGKEWKSIKAWKRMEEEHGSIYVLRFVSMDWQHELVKDGQVLIGSRSNYIFCVIIHIT